MRGFNRYFFDFQEASMDEREMRGQGGLLSEPEGCSDFRG
jgi:hypothetical protein